MHLLSKTLTLEVLVSYVSEGGLARIVYRPSEPDQFVQSDSSSAAASEDDGSKTGLYQSTSDLARTSPPRAGLKCVHGDG